MSSYVTVEKDFVKKIFPNKLPKIKRSWLTSAVVGISTTIREEGAWDSLPILADALMDAGCANEKIISHLRTTSVEIGVIGADIASQNVHYGCGCWFDTCWVIQSLLGLPQKIMAFIRDKDSVEASFSLMPTLNPGEFGTAFLIGSPEFDTCDVAIEAACYEDAEVLFVDSDLYGKNCRLLEATFPEDGMRESAKGHQFHPDLISGLGPFKADMRYIAPGLGHRGIPVSNYYLKKQAEEYRKKENKNV